MTGCIRGRVNGKFLAFFVEIPRVALAGVQTPQSCPLIPLRVGCVLVRHVNRAVVSHEKSWNDVDALRACPGYLRRSIVVDLNTELGVW